MVPRLLTVARPPRKSQSPIVKDTTDDVLEISSDFSVLRRRPRDAIKAAKLPNITVGVSAPNNTSRALYKRCLSETACFPSETSQWNRKGKPFALDDAKPSAESSLALTGCSFFHLGDDVFDDVTNVLENTLRRQCFQPIWSLIGTFKTNIHSVVDTDPHHDTLKWYQRTPKNDFQQMRIPLSSIKEIRISSAPPEEMGPNWVIIRTSTKPTQIVFGFEKLSEAKRMRAALHSFLNA
ncbi:hypothetical protein TraAM80_05991 [Trypanosoma rangeli]|uniref:PH-like domain-containing protein n=1 Tax=Trypanosoma rangeli TaxID=5698 RepID=A0A422NCD0_TRYRA|nr:uncharacterized protein TraAM80_05991 [Trypanosoma rangeli]RNF03123.1 hypothetical protein TraAM80_05991 [Trypanosoma rangeli]|eukprot:RNF03123.1 hypothetical protein TraAM80_05991 [Trypanosoma rangeli]